MLLPWEIWWPLHTGMLIGWRVSTTIPKIIGLSTQQCEKLLFCANHLHENTHLACEDLKLYLRMCSLCTRVSVLVQDNLASCYMHCTFTYTSQHYSWTAPSLHCVRLKQTNPMSSSSVTSSSPSVILRDQKNKKKPQKQHSGKTISTILETQMNFLKNHKYCPSEGLLRYLTW